MIRPAIACAVAGLCLLASSTSAVAQGFEEILSYDVEVVFESGIVTESTEVRALQNEFRRGIFTTAGLSSALGIGLSSTFYLASSGGGGLYRGVGVCW